MLDLREHHPGTPRLPHHWFSTIGQIAVSALMHVTAVMIATAFKPAAIPDLDPHGVKTTTVQQQLDVRHIVFLAPETRRIGGGGGGGGNRQSGPIRRAQGDGSGAITLRTRKPPPAGMVVSSVSPMDAEDLPPLPTIVLDVKPLAAGFFEQLGLPAGGVSSGTSTGPGSGGGVGTGIGTGIGAGQGPGLGAGSGGGIGGGVYRPGGAVTAPRVLKEVRPTYTTDALLHKIQGTVVLELIVTRDGHPSQIRVVRSLDPGGLDEEATAAAAQWRFTPGRLAGTPVDVLVTIMLDFWIR